MPTTARGEIGALGEPIAILPDDRGAPTLPPGWVGSISHKRGLAVALAAPARAGERIGVDVEVRRPPRLDLAPRILTEAERAAIADLEPHARGLAVALRFSLKEAIYKSIDPFLRRYVGFREVAVFPEDGVARVERELGFGQHGAVEPGLAVDVAGHADLAQQRAGTPGGEGHVPDPADPGHREGVAGDLWQRLVPGDGGHGQQLDLGAAVGEQQRDGVVVPGVTVEQDLAGHGRRTYSVSCTPALQRSEAVTCR